MDGESQFPTFMDMAESYYEMSKKETIGWVEYIMESSDEEPQDGIIHHNLSNMFAVGALSGDDEKILKIRSMCTDDAYKQGRIHEIDVQNIKTEIEDVKTTVSIIYMEMSAKAGHGLSQVVLGQLYMRGDLVAKDMKKSVDWFMIASTCTDKTISNYAKLELAKYFLKRGDGIVKDGLEILEMLSADPKNLNAIFELSMYYYYTDDVTLRHKSKPLLVQLTHVEGGTGSQYAHAEYCLGMLYLHGINGAKKNTKTAVYWFERAAEHGDPNGQYELAVHLASAKDHDVGDRIKQLCIYAAEQDHPPAQHKLSRIYFKEGNIDMGKKWLEISIQQEYRPAMTTLERNYRLGENGYPIDADKADEMHRLHDTSISNKKLHSSDSYFLKFSYSEYKNMYYQPSRRL